MEYFVKRVDDNAVYIAILYTQRYTPEFITYERALPVAAWEEFLSSKGPTDYYGVTELIDRALVRLDSRERDNLSRLSYARDFTYYLGAQMLAKHKMKWRLAAQGYGYEPAYYISQSDVPENLRVTQNKRTGLYPSVFGGKRLLDCEWLAPIQNRSFGEIVSMPLEEYKAQLAWARLRARAEREKQLGS